MKEGILTGASISLFSSSLFFLYALLAVWHKGWRKTQTDLWKMERYQKTNNEGTKAIFCGESKQAMFTLWAASHEKWIQHICTHNTLMQSHCRKRFLGAHEGTKGFCFLCKLFLHSIINVTAACCYVNDRAWGKKMVPKGQCREKFVPSFHGVKYGKSQHFV